MKCTRRNAAKWKTRRASLHTLFLIAFLCLTISPVPRIYSQTTDLLPQSDHTVRSRVNLVLVDVVVTDRNGQPVTGLSQDDFEVLERTAIVGRGQKQRILSFEEHRGRPAAGASMPQLPPHVYTNEPPVPVADAVNVLLLDALNTPLGDQSNVRREMIEYLKEIEPGPRLAIFTLSSDLRIVQGFTSDPHVLLAALNNKKWGGGPQPSALRSSAEGSLEQRGLQQMAEVQEMANNSAPAAGASGGPGSSGNDSISSAMAALQRFQTSMNETVTASRTFTTLDALRQLARYLSGYPGRKNVIWFAGSFPLELLPLGDGLRSEGDRSFDGPTKSVLSMLASAQVALYPVSTLGADPNSLYDVATVSARAGGSVTNQGPNVEGQRQSLRADSIYRAANSSAMDGLAMNTGGRAFYGSNGFIDAINNAVRTGSYYYRLSYSPEDKTMLGNYRRIEVKLHKGHYKLFYRRGYFEEGKPKSDDAATSTADYLQPMMIRGLPESTQIVYRLRVSPLEAEPAPSASVAGDNKELRGPLTRVSADFVIPLNELTLDRGNDGIYRGNLELGIVAYDHAGKPLNWLFRNIRASLKPELYTRVLSSGARFHQEIDVPQADVFLRAGVFDIASNKVGTLEIPLSKSKLIADDISELLGNLPVRATRLVFVQNVPVSGATDNAAVSTKTSVEPLPVANDAGRILQDPSDVKAYCKDVAGALEHANALASVCEFALSANKKLPDILCDREMKRNWSEPFTTPEQIVNVNRSDVVTARLRYTNGQEHYEDVRVNGKAVRGSVLDLSGTSSVGEFANILAGIFRQPARSTFQFEKETTVHSRKAAVFTYRVEARNNKFYLLHVDERLWFPTYTGRLWIDEQSLQLLTLELETVYMPSEPIRRVTAVINYADLPMGDESRLILPTQSNVVICMPPSTGSRKDACSRHFITFKNWHKFRAKARLLSDSPN